MNPNRSLVRQYLENAKNTAHISTSHIATSTSASTSAQTPEEEKENKENKYLSQTSHARPQLHNAGGAAGEEMSRSEGGGAQRYGLKFLMNLWSSKTALW